MQEYTLKEIDDDHVEYTTWNGGINPVKNKVVSVVLRCGKSGINRSNYLKWEWLNDSSDIVAYAVIKNANA